MRERTAALFYSNKTISRSGHVVDRNLDLAVAAGASSVVRTFPLPAGRPEGELPGGTFVLACPLAGWRSKQWPLEYYGQLAVRLRRELGIPLVVDGPASAWAIFSEVPQAVAHTSTIAGLIHATRRAAAVVGVDSGPLHIAAALGRPGVAVFGPTDPARNGPYGDSFTVLRSPHSVTSYKRRAEIDPSMTRVSPDEVFEALRGHLIRQTQSAGCLA